MLTLPSAYTSALGQSIKENYLVQLYNDTGNIGKSISVYTTTVSSVLYHGVITNVPTIRESIDLNTSTSSLSNISISCADDNLSDLLLATRTYLNREVRVYSQLDDETNLSNCLLLFKGILRSVQSTENKLTLQISAKRPFENINVPKVQSLQGNYVPIVFGDYNSYTFSSAILGTKLQNTTTICHPVPVDTVKEGKIITLAHEQGSAVNTGHLHVQENSLFRTTGSENMSKAGGTLLNNESATTLTAQDGSTTIYGRAAQLDLRRSGTSLVGVADVDFGGSTAISSDKTTILVDRTETNQGPQKAYHFTINDIGTIKHTPELITLNLNFSNVAINITDFSQYRVRLDVKWGSDNIVDVSNYTAVTRNVLEDQITSIADISTAFKVTSALNQTTISEDGDNSGNLPVSVTVEFTFYSSSGGAVNYDIDFDCQPEFAFTTKLDETATNVQSTSDIVNNIKELYSGQDGFSLDGALITKPIAAHRYLCETFMSSEFGATPPSSYTELLAHQSGRGTMHYYINKQMKLEDVLKKLQHFGAFIMRYKSDGTYAYQSSSFLSTSTTASTIKPYLLNIGTLQTAGGSGIDSDDSDFGVDITHGSETLGHGDIIAMQHPSVSGMFEFVKVFMTDTSIVGADISFAQCERNLMPSNTNTSFPENAVVYKVKFPHAKLTDNDFTDLQINHLPLDKIVTRYLINYHKNPGESNKYLEQKTFTDSSQSSKYNITTENVKEVKNEIDVNGQLSDYYYHHYGSLSNGPKVKISLNIINPDFYNIEVGDIIKFDGQNTTQTPFGLAPKGLTANPNAFDRLYFIVTSTSRTLGKISISAQEIY